MRTPLKVAAIVALVLVLAAEAWYLWFAGDPEPTAARPVTVSEVTVAGAVDTAARSVGDILSTSWQDYDQQARAAERLMTPTFERHYRGTSDQIRSAFIAAKTKVDMHVAWAGVYRASAKQVQVLLFLDQVSSRGTGSPRTIAFRALATVVPKGTGWLVSEIDTR